MKTILVPLDFSDSSKGVLATAIKFAQALHTTLTLLHVVQPIVATGDSMLDAAQLTEAQKAAEEFGHMQLKKIRQRLAARGLAVKTDLRTGMPSTIILDRARSLPATLVVMGSHGHTAFYDLLLGSTSHAVLKNAPCPVLIVPSKK